MEKLLQEFYDAHDRRIWLSEGSQIREFSEWAKANGHNEELSFIEGKRYKKLCFLWLALALLTTALIAFGAGRYEVSFFPIGLIVLVLLPILTRRTPTLTKAQPGEALKPASESS